MMKKSFYILIFVLFIFFSISLNSFSKDNQKLKLMVNRSFNNFQNLFVIDENTIASLEKYKEIWDIKNKRLIESTSYTDKYIDSFGLPGVASNIQAYQYNSEDEYCDPVFDLKNGGRLNCEQIYNVIPSLAPEEDRDKKELPRNINSLNITNEILKDYDLDIKVKEENLEIKRSYSNLIKIFDKKSNKYQRIWKDNIYWGDNSYFILEKNILKSYDLGSLSLTKEFNVSNFLENVYEYKNKLILQYNDRVDFLDYKSGKIIYSLKDDTKNISSKYIITADNKIIITYKINNFNKDSYYDSWDKIYTKIFNFNTGKFLSKIEIKAYGGYFGILDAKIKTPYLIGRMGPARNWIDVWNINSGKIKHIIVPIESIKTFNVYDGKIILGSQFSNFEIYDINSGKLIKLIERDRNSNKEDLRFSSEIIKTIIYKNQIISSYSDNTIKILDLSTGNLLKVLSGHQKEINDIYLEKDLLVSIDKSGVINTWNLQSKKLINTKQTQTTGELKVYNSRIFIKGQEEVIDIVGTKSQKLIKTIKNYDSPITAIVKDNNTIYAGTKSGDIYVIDYITGNIGKTLKGLNNEKISFILLDNKNNLIYGNYKGNLVIHNITTQTINTINLEKYISNTYLYQNKLFIELSSGFKLEDKKLFIIDYLSGKINIQELNDYYRSITFFKDKIYYVSKDQLLKELNLNTNESKDIFSSNFMVYDSFVYSHNSLFGDSHNSNIEYLFNDNFLLSIVKERKDSNKLILDILDLKTHKIKKVFDTEKSDLILINKYVYNKKAYLLKYNSKEEYFIEAIDLEQGTLISRNKIENFNFNINRQIDEVIRKFFIRNKLLLIKSNLINRNSELSFFNIDNLSYLKTIKEYLVNSTDKIFVTQKNNNINIWDIENLNKIDSIQVGDNEIALLLKDNKLITQNNNQISIYDIKIYSKIYSFTDKDISSPITISYLNNENMIYNTNNNYFKYTNLKTKQITKLIDSYLEKIDDNYISFKKLDNLNNDIYNIYDLKNRRILFKIKNDYYYNINLYDDKNKILLEKDKDLILKNIKTNQTIKEFKNYNFILPLKNFYNTDKLILKNKEGDIEIFDINTLKLLSTYYILETATFMITPQGYFSGEGDYQNYFYFKSESGEYISLDKLQEFNKPDIVKKSLDGEDISSYKKLDYSM